MKIFAYVSCDSLAYTPACLNTVLSGRGVPPSCPAYATAFPGSGQIPMLQQIIEVSEAADCYEKIDGKWIPVSDGTYARFTADGAAEPGSTPDFVYRHAEELRRRSFFAMADIAAAMKIESQKSTLLGAKK